MYLTEGTHRLTVTSLCGGWDFDCLEIEDAEAGVVFNEENFPDANFRQYLKENFRDKGFTTEGVTVSTYNLNRILEISCGSRSISSLKGIEYFTALETLSCHDNQLTSLDISNNSALTTLECHNNQLSELDLSNNTALITLYCQNNHLRSLDLSNQTTLAALNISNQTATADLLILSNTTAGIPIVGAAANYSGMSIIVPRNSNGSIETPKVLHK